WIVLEDFRAGDVRRHQVWSKLNAAKRQVKRVCKCPDHQRLCQPRNADQQGMAARKHGDQKFFKYALLANDDLLEFVANTAVALVESFDRGQIVVLAVVQRGGRGRSGS